MKNLCAKTRPKDQPYEVWRNTIAVFGCPAGSWTWHVLKKWQADDNKPYARWFCNVVTPLMPNGEMGDVYVTDVTGCAARIR